MTPIHANTISGNTSNAISHCVSTDCHSKDPVPPRFEHISSPILQKIPTNEPHAIAERFRINTIANKTIPQNKDLRFQPVQPSASNKKQKPVLQARSRIPVTHPAVPLPVPVQRNESKLKDDRSNQFIADAEIPGRLPKNIFLQTLKGRVYLVANKVLAQINQTAAQCPYINKWFLYYSGRTAAEIGSAIERFAPLAASAQSLEAYLNAICARIEAGLMNHVKTGSIDDVPNEIVEKEHKPLDFVHIAENPAAQLARLCGDSDLDRALENFDSFKVVNMTNIAFLLVEKEDDQKKAFKDRADVWRGRTKGHVVNKWERYEDGERDYGGEEYYGGHDRKTNSTNAAEARHMGKDPAEYLQLAPQRKMQFALLDFRNNPRSYSEGWGRSYFEIKKSKVNSSGYLHFGDSRYNMFDDGGKGKYSEFHQKLRASPELAKRFANPKTIEDNWIEVNIADGISLPGDIEKLVVHPNELRNTLTEHNEIIPGDSADQKKAAFERALTDEFGANVEYK